jgi:hypothetical protein
VHGVVWKLNLLVRRENNGVVCFYEKLGYGDRIVLRSENGWMAEQIDPRAIEYLFSWPDPDRRVGVNHRWLIECPTCRGHSRARR